MLISLVIMLSVVLSGGGLHYFATSEVTPAVYSSRSWPTFWCFGPCATTDVALTREFLCILVLWLLLRTTLHWLLALVLLLLWAEAWLLRLRDRVAAAPQLPPVARWITTPWISWAQSCCTLLPEVYVAELLSPFCRLVHWCWVVDKDAVLCGTLKPSDVMVQRFSGRKNAAL